MVWLPGVTTGFGTAREVIPTVSELVHPVAESRTVRLYIIDVPFDSDTVGLSMDGLLKPDVGVQLKLVGCVYTKSIDQDVILPASGDSSSTIYKLHTPFGLPVRLPNVCDPDTVPGPGAE